MLLGSPGADGRGGGGGGGDAHLSFNLISHAWLKKREYRIQNDWTVVSQCLVVSDNRRNKI